jgi:hypothetical protein
MWRMSCETLNFDPNLVPLIVKGEKTASYRVNNRRHLVPGERLTLCCRATTPGPFAVARIVDVFEKPLAELDSVEDGHETYPGGLSEMIETFQGYYPQADITEATPVTVVKYAPESFAKYDKDGHLRVIIEVDD